MKPGYGDVRARLRAATGSLHNDVEDGFNLAGVTDSQSYARRLYAFYIVYNLVLDPLCRCGLGEVDMAPLRYDLGCLHRDLARIGPVPGVATMTGVANGVGVDGKSELAFNLTSTQEGMGCRYVLEGSRLGARLVARRLKPVLAVDASRGAAFFDVDADATRRRWQSFAGDLERACRSESDIEAAISGARKTFGLFLAVFNDRRRLGMAS